MSSRLFVLCLMLFIAVAVASQEATLYPDNTPTRSVTLLNNYQAVIPEDWTVNTEDDAVIIDAGDLIITLTEPNALDITDDATTEDVLTLWTAVNYNLELTDSRIRTYEFDTSRAVLTSASPDMFLVVLDFSANDKLLVEFSAVGSLLPDQFQLLPIFLENVTVFEEPEPTPTTSPTAIQVFSADDELTDTAEITSSPTNSAGATVNDERMNTVTVQVTPTTPPTLSAPCSVTIVEPDTQVRVGPGNNRSVLYLLDEGTFTVIGRNNDSQGNVWFKLDKEEVDANTFAAEIWIDASLVESEGDCVNVTNSEAPPVIRRVTVLTPVPQSNTTNTEGNLSNNGDEQNESGPVEPRNVPRAFTNWVFRLDTRMTIVCDNGSTDTVSTQLLGIEYTGNEYEINYREFYANVFTADQDRIVFVDSSRLEIVAPSVYSGAVDFRNSSGGFLNLIVQGPEFMVGTLSISNVPLDGKICTAQIPLTAERPRIFFDD